MESEYLEKKSSYDKVAVGLEMDKQSLEKECDTFQVFRYVTYSHTHLFISHTRTHSLSLSLSLCQTSHFPQLFDNLFSQLLTFDTG